MKTILIIEVISYFGLLVLQSIWASRRELTEQRFALFQIASLSLIIITVVLFSASSNYPLGLLAGIIGTMIFAIIGYPVLRWIYRQVFPPN